MSDEAAWVRIEREFDAPVETVWAMWTEAEMFQKWYGPMGASVPVAEMDLTVGGTRKIAMEMQTPKGPMRMWFTGVYKEIEAPRRLVYTESMCDENGTIITAEQMGMPPGHPDVTDVIVDLSDEDGRTRMVMVHVGVPAGSPGAGGWGMAFDKLAAALAD